jgi:hypothetical protein
MTNRHCPPVVSASGDPGDCFGKVRLAMTGRQMRLAMTGRQSTPRNDGPANAPRNDRF